MDERAEERYELDMLQHEDADDAREQEEGHRFWDVDDPVLPIKGWRR